MSPISLIGMIYRPHKNTQNRTVVEGCGEYPDWTKNLTAEQQKKMFDSSPMAHVEKIVAPYMLLIGEKDLRVVPHYKGFIRNLQARGVPTRLVVQFFPPK